MRVLVTRPQPAADRTASRLITLGHTPVTLPLFEAVHFPDLALQAIQRPSTSIIATSAEVFRVLETIRDKIVQQFSTPIFAVGLATREAALKLGFVNVMAGTSGGAELADQIAEQAKLDSKISEDLLYLAGRPRSPELEDRLAANQIRCQAETVYEMRPINITGPELHNAMSQAAPEAILFYSAETARHFFSLATEHGNDNILKDVRLLCLSRNIAAVIPQSLQKHVETSDRPDETSLLDLLSQA